MIAFVIIPCLLLALVLWRRQQALNALRREAFIRSFSLPPRLFEPLRAQHPQLTLKDCQLVAQGLRQFFLAYLKSGHRYVSMPSQAADDLWHAFILHTHDYQAFCQKAFGRFLHHTPAAVLGNGRQQSDAGLRRCWWHACREENINPRSPTRLPLLFALDGKLGISNGFSYVADCESVRKLGANGSEGGVIHCGSDLSSSSADGGSGTATDSYEGDGSGEAAGDSGGCGGGGD